MPWYIRRSLGACSICGGLAGDVVSVTVAWQQLRNRAHHVRSQYDLLLAGRSSRATVLEALNSLEAALQAAREVIQTGRGTATVDQWANLQDTYSNAEYTFNATTRLMEEGPAAEPGAPPRPPVPGAPPPPVPIPGPKGAPPTGAMTTLTTVTQHPAFWPVVIGTGAVGAFLLLTGGKPKGR